MWMASRRSSPRVGTTRKRIACFSEKNRFSKICIKSFYGTIKRSASQRHNSKRSAACALKSGRQLASSAVSGNVRKATRSKSTAVSGWSAVDRHPQHGGQCAYRYDDEESNSSSRQQTVTAGVIKENHGKVNSSSKSSNIKYNFATKNTSADKYAMVDRDPLTSHPVAGAVGVGQSSSTLNHDVDHLNSNQQQQQQSIVLPAGATTSLPDRNGNNTELATMHPSANRALCDIENNNSVIQDSSTAIALVNSVDSLQSTDELTVVSRKKTKKSRKDKGEDGKKSKSSDHKKRRSRIAPIDFSSERPEDNSAEFDSAGIDWEDDPDAAEWAKLRCTSDSTEVVAEREARRQRRCADYPGLAFGGSIFGTDTMMKFNIIRNELHNIMKTQLKRVTLFALSSR